LRDQFDHAHRMGVARRGRAESSSWIHQDDHDQVRYSGFKQRYDFAISNRRCRGCIRPTPTSDLSLGVPGSRTAGRRQRYPAGVLAVVAGVAIDVTGAVGGAVVVAVASGADLTVSVPACSLATATAPMITTALAPITAESNLTLFCWSTLTTPFGPGPAPPHRRCVPFEGAGAQVIRSYALRKD